MTATVMTKPEKTKKRVTWRDFSFKEHVAGYIGQPTGSELRIIKVWENTYRVNCYKDGSVVKSSLLRIIETPEGYVFEDHST